MSACGLLARRGTAFQIPREPATRINVPVLQCRADGKYGRYQRDAPQRRANRSSSFRPIADLLTQFGNLMAKLHHFLAQSDHQNSQLCFPVGSGESIRVAFMRSHALSKISP